MSALRNGLLGKKLGMTQIFDAQGDRIPVTAILASPNFVLGKRTMEKDGYTAVQLGFGEKPLRTANMPEKGLASKLGIPPQRLVRELRLAAEDLEKFEVGKAIPVEQIFQVGTYVDVTGRTKGKGYQGVMKRHHMPGFRSTHGTHEFFRHGGSIGCRLTPGRVHKGKRMSGHLGDVKRTVQNLAIIDIIADQGVILIEGSVPGGKNGFVVIKNAIKRSGPVRARHIEETKSKKTIVSKKK